MTLLTIHRLGENRLKLIDALGLRHHCDVMSTMVAQGAPSTVFIVLVLLSVANFGVRLADSQHSEPRGAAASASQDTGGT